MAEKNTLEIPLEDIRQIQKRLLAWYRENHRKLPWRETTDPYRIWVSEVMLQQTQVDTVVPYYQKFLRRFPSIEILARADVQDVLKVWEGLGYYARARNLHRAAGMVADQSGGLIPRDANQIRKLPGIGDYIAAAVLSIAFKLPCAVVDGNVKRVLSRLFCVAQAVNAPAAHRLFQAMARKILDEMHPDSFNQGLMELGALVCKPVRPQCPRCPLSGSCRAFQTRTTADYPRRIKRKPTPTHHIATGVVYHKGRLLITQRKPEGLLGGLWEFPGGKVKPEETPAVACVREIKEETNLSVEITGFIKQVKHAYTHFKIVMDVFSCRHVGGKIKLTGPVAHRWIKREEIDSYPFPKANHKFFPELKKYRPADKKTNLT